MTPQEYNNRPINKLHKGCEITLKNGEKHLVYHVEGTMFSKKIMLESGRKIEEEDVLW
jgi:hypothetical protein